MDILRYTVYLRDGYAEICSVYLRDILNRCHVLGCSRQMQCLRNIPNRHGILGAYPTDATFHILIRHRFYFGYVSGRCNISGTPDLCDISGKHWTDAVFQNNQMDELFQEHNLSDMQ